MLSFRVEVEESFAVDLKSGHTVHAGSPPGSGIVLAYILRILDGMLPAPNTGLDAHRLVEAFKFAYGERSHLGDHRFVNVSDVRTRFFISISFRHLPLIITDDFFFFCRSTIK